MSAVDSASSRTWACSASRCAVHAWPAGRRSRVDMAGVTSWRLVGVPAPAGTGAGTVVARARGGHGATSRILTTLTEASRLVPGRLQGFRRQSGDTARPTVARWGGRPVARPWGRVGRRAWTPGLSSPTCDPPRSLWAVGLDGAGRWSGVGRPGRGATRCRLPASVLHAPEGVRDIGTGRGPGRRWYPVPDGACVRRAGSVRSPVPARPWCVGHPVPSGGVAGSYPSGPTTGHSGVPSWWEKRGRGFQPDNSHSRGGTARAGSPHSGHARATGVPVARGGAPLWASFAVMASGLPWWCGRDRLGAGTSVPGPKRGGVQLPVLAGTDRAGAAVSAGVASAGAGARL